MNSQAQIQDLTTPLMTLCAKPNNLATLDEASIDIAKVNVVVNSAAAFKDTISKEF